MEYSTKVLLGVRIKELRKIRGLTQDQLSAKINIDPKHLSRLEVGKSFPSFVTLEKLADVLKIELKDFFEFTNKAKSTKALRKVISDLLDDMDKEKLRMVVKVLNAVLK